jgi:hypothetical protein
MPRLPSAARAGLLDASLAAVVMLTACTGEPTPVATPPASSAPAPTQTPVTDPGPTSRIDLDCDDLVDPVVLQTFIGGDAPLVAVTVSDRLTPDRASFEQLGGLVCEWTNHPEPSYWGPPDGVQSVAVRVLPEGLDQAAAYVETYQIADPTYGEHVQGPRCVAPDGFRTTGFCEVVGAIGPTWAELSVSGIVPAPGTTDASLRDAFRTAVADRFVAGLQSTTPGPRWSPDEVGAAGACETALSSTQVAELTGFPEVWFGESWDGPRVGQYFFATGETGGKRCAIHPDAGQDAMYGAVYLLPGGSWAFDRYRESWIAAGATPQTVAGVPADAALLRCVDEAAECRLDLVVGGDWIAVVFPPVPDETAAGMPMADYAAARASIVPLAEAVVANLASGA